MKKISAAVNRAVEAVTVGFMAVMLALVAAQIVTRYVLNSPPAWIDEAARYSMVWTSLLGATIGLYRGLDPKLMARRVFTRPAINRLVGAGRPVAIAGFFVPLIWFSFDFLARHSHRTTDTLNLNSAVVVSIVPISAAIVLLHLVAQTFYPETRRETQPESGV